MQRHDIETRDVEGENHGLHGQERDEATRQKISESLEGRDVSDEERERMAAAHEGNELTESTREKIAAAIRGTTRDEQTRKKMSASTSGPKNANWRGGYSRRYGEGWSVARDAARARDQVCQHCGHDGSKRRLEVHHVVPVRVFRSTDGVGISDAHVLNNLVLLCKSCHGKADQGVLDFSVEPEVLPDEIGEIYK